MRHGIMVDPEASDALQADLLRRISTQDHKAVAEFYDQVAGVLFSTAVRILRDTHDAEEIIQEVFVQIWNKAASFDATLGTPFDWTLRITRNRCIDTLRSRQRQNRLLENAAGVAAIDATPSLSCARELLSGDEFAAIRAAVQTLPEDQRKVIEMAFFGGRTHVEIAEALQEPLGTVKARIRRGMLKLRESLQAYL